MAELDIRIGNGVFRVACEDGEEAALQRAADLLNTQATILNEAIGTVPESRMLLMAGLMLGDRHLDLEGKLAAAQDKIKALELRAERAEAQAVASAEAAPVADAPEEAGAREAQMALFNDDATRSRAMLEALTEELEILADEIESAVAA